MGKFLFSVVTFAFFLNHSIAADFSKPHFHLSKFGTEGHAINERNEVLGLHEYRVGQGQEFVQAQRPIVWDAQTSAKISIPKTLEEYTAMAGKDISPDGTIVGRAARFKASQAFLSTKEQGTIGLGTLPGKDFSSANAIAKDRIVGSAAGGMAPEVACVWNRADNKLGWEIAPLPIKNAGPATALAISSDGKFIGGQDEDKPVVWIEANGKWIRHTISSTSGKVSGINNNGEFVGYLNTTKQVGQPASRLGMYGSLKEHSLIALAWIPERGYGESTANAINDAGVVVGNSWTLSGKDSDGWIWSKKNPELKRFRINKNGDAVISAKFEPPIEAQEGEEEGAEVSTVLIDITDAGVILGQAEQPEKKVGDYEVQNMFVYKY